MRVLKWVTCGVLLFGLFSCNKDEIESAEEDIQPRLIGMSFHYADNPVNLVEDISCEIQGDSLVTCRIPYMVFDKQLVPYFAVEGTRVEVDGMVIESGKSTVDFTRPIRLSVEVSGGGKKWYTVRVQTFTGLPVLWLTTENHQEIASKEEYIKGHLKLYDDLCEYSENWLSECDLQVKGRGNTNWKMPKKPYRLKLDEKKDLLGMAKDKSWVLQTNYLDQTMVHTAIAFYLGSISKLDYTPKSRFVELMLNGRYNGTYQLIEKLKISKDRVNVGDDGFLLEIDHNHSEGDVIFSVENLNCPVNIKEPDNIAVGDENYKYIKRYVTDFDTALFSDDFKDSDNGYSRYIDVESFVDWYVIEELLGNCDAELWTSCYMHKSRGGKLMMGPLWDFDLSFGGDGLEPSRFAVASSSWYKRLLEDPAFVSRVKERLRFFRDRQDDIMREIDAKASMLRYATVENNNKWNTLYTYPYEGFKDTSLEIWGNYQNEIQNMKNWLMNRFVCFEEMLNNLPS